MTSQTSGSSAAILHDPKDFSLVIGGPLFQLLLRAHLTSDAMTLITRRIIVFVLVTWLPLLLLSALDGHLLDGSVVIPFLMDVETHIRFLLVVPLLLVAELLVHRRLLVIGRTFLERNLIREADMKRFDAAVASVWRLRNSTLAEVLLLGFVYAVGVLIIWRRYTVIDTSTWYVTTHADGFRFSRAGWWYVYISLPAFQFLLLRWYFRLLIWIRFLWQVSRIQLALLPTHPDHVGGLGFLAFTVYAFSVLLIAHGAMLAGQIATRIFFVRASLLDFKAEIAVMIGFLMGIVFGPLLVFSSQLAEAKRTGLREYGTLAWHYVRDFDGKWLRGGVPAGEPLLGSADIQSLADMANSFSVVQSMRLVPITRDAVLKLAAAALLPLAPLLLTAMSAEQLLRKLIGLVF